MGAFYVSIIFIGILLVIGSLIFIAIDKVNGKDYFKEFDRKKEEMFNLIQDSEEMIQELNKMSDYVVTMISEKNQEYFEKVNKGQTSNPDPTIDLTSKEQVYETQRANIKSVTYTPTIPVRINPVPSVPVTNIPEPVMPDKAETAIREEIASESQEALLPKAPEKVTEIVKEANTEVLNENTKKDPNNREFKKVTANPVVEEINQSGDFNTTPGQREKREVNTQMSNITERLNETDANKTRLVLNNKRREVLKMIEQGMSNDEIADKLKIGKGEIGLIRGLSK